MEDDRTSAVATRACPAAEGHDVLVAEMAAEAESILESREVDLLDDGRALVEVGGYLHDTVGEDMELVVRLHRRHLPLLRRGGSRGAQLPPLPEDT